MQWDREHFVIDFTVTQTVEQSVEMDPINAAAEPIVATAQFFHEGPH